MKKRIWELDAFRGLCLLGMVLIHLIYDLTELYGFVSWNLPAWFVDFQEWAGSLFLILSGLCATLGSRPVRRGLTVLAGGNRMLPGHMGHCGTGPCRPERYYLLRRAALSGCLYAPVAAF